MIVFTMHGMMGNSHDFDFLTPALAPIEVYNLELIGHSLSDSESFDFAMIPTWDEVITKYQREILEKASGRPFILLGYSMGGRVLTGVLSKLLDTPAKLSGLILESSHLGNLSEQERLERKVMDQSLFKGINSPFEREQFLRKWWSAPLFGNFSQQEFFEDLIAAKKIESCDGYQWSLNALSVANQPDYSQMICENKKIPILYLAGRDDQKYSQIAKDLKGQEMIETRVFNCGHNTHLCAREDFIDVVREWIKKRHPIGCL